MLTSPVDDSNILLHLLNYSTFCLCLVSKIPSIVLVARAKSSKGFSLKGLLLELTGYVVFVTYQIHHAAPSSTFLEYPILIAQDTVLLLLILYYNGKAKHSLIYIALYPPPNQNADVQSLCTLISASSKFASAQCLYQSKDSSGVSALAWSISCYTCLARMFTTIMTTADIQVLTRFAVLSSLNGFVLAMIFHYRRDVKKVE
ncbi:solute carrier family 66 member 3-like isoform X2 [Salvelinus namaycush]|uniref:Solute carrier family 66 member 3-like isoform X2 n=1 Tax=Salvelinus namaycush TaxID=8040 RepID=A0A8U0PGD3_SALNM|nr:PQ-loop repeat-containing protein 3 isoform X2 [Salvelinus alpinus]XP_038824108.1 solute carrier family 66 member 3-like isoform X2 [Salvelinus namaycush]